MDQKDINDFKDALLEISKEDGDSQEGESGHDRDKLLDKYHDEATQLEKENTALKVENNLLLSSMEIEEGPSTSTAALEDVTLTEHDFEMGSTQDEVTVHDGVEVSHDQDDLSSIFSDGEEELRHMAQESKVIRNALMNLKKEHDFWISADTASETSDDADTLVSSRSFRDNTADRMQITKLLAEKEYLELKLSQVTHDKKETETKLRHLEKDSTRVMGWHGDNRNDSPRYSSQRLEPENFDVRRTESGMRLAGQEVKKTPRSKPAHKRNLYVDGIGNKTNVELHLLRARSTSPQFVKGYECDIAILAEENEKLGEIIDHLQINSDDPTSRNGSMDTFLAAFENRVPKEEFLRLENEKIKLEHIVREKERLIKEKERIIEENKNDYEDEIRYVKEAVRKAEDKLKEKSRVLCEYEMQILDMKSTFSEQLRTIEIELEVESEQKLRLEQINIGLAENNERFHKEIEDLKHNLARLHNREKEMENKYTQHVMILEEKLKMESTEKTQLSGNLEELVQDLMMLKNKLLEESDRNGKLRKAFQNQMVSLGGIPSTGMKRGGIKIGGMERGRDPSLPSKELPFSEIDQEDSRSRDEANLPSVSQQKDGEDKYIQMMQEEQEKRKGIEEAYQELLVRFNELSKQQEGKVGFVPTHIGTTEGAIEEVPSQTEEETGSHQAQLPTAQAQPSPPSVTLNGKFDDLDQENKYLKERLEEMGKEKGRRRELEEQNEELQEEISQMSSKGNELQRKQERFSNDIEQLNDKVKELERNNSKLSEEVDELTDRIKEMEKSFDEEKSNLTLDFQKEKQLAVEEAYQDLEEQKSRNTELEEEIKSLKEQFSNFEENNEKSKDRFGHDNEEAREKCKEEIDREREKSSRLQEEVNKNADAVKKVTEEWEKMLRNTVQKYEADLKTSEEEKRSLISQSQDINKKHEVDNAYVNENVSIIVQGQVSESQPPSQDVSKDDKYTQNVNVPLSYDLGNDNPQSDRSDREVLPDSVQEQPLPRSSGNDEVQDKLYVQEKVGQVDQADVEESKPGLESFPIGSSVEVEYTAIIPDVHIEVSKDDVSKDDKYTQNVNVSLSYDLGNDNPQSDRSDREVLPDSVQEQPLPRFSGNDEVQDKLYVQEKVGHVDQADVEESKPGLESFPIGSNVEVEYTAIIPDLHIEVELQQEQGPSAAESKQETTFDDSAVKKLEEERQTLSEMLVQKQNEMNNLMDIIKQLEEQLVNREKQEKQRNEESASVHELGRISEDDFRKKLEENSKYYERLLDELKTRLETEKRELEEKLNKESEELQQQMKEEFSKNLTSRSNVLENKIHDLVSEKVHEHKEQTRKLEFQLEMEKAKYTGELQKLGDKITEYENGRDESVRRLEREKKILRVTIQALTKELGKVKQERKELKKTFKKNKAEMQNAFDKDRKQFSESLERSKEVQRLKVEEEWREKFRIEIEKYEEKFEGMTAEIYSYESKIEELVTKFKDERHELENELQESRLEVDNLLEQKNEFNESLEEEYQRKLRKEKENIESTLESLRQEINRLREHRMQLQSQLHLHGSERDSGHGSTHAHGVESIAMGNKEILSRLENEYQNQLTREKQYYEDKILHLENDYEALSEELTSLKSKYRQERAMMKAEFERERVNMEDKLDRERQELQELLQLRMQSLRDSRRTIQTDRKGPVAQRNRVLQNEVHMLQQKVARLEVLSPQIIEMAVQQHQGLQMNPQSSSGYLFNQSIGDPTQQRTIMYSSGHGGRDVMQSPLMQHSGIYSAGQSASDSTLLGIQRSSALSAHENERSAAQMNTQNPPTYFESQDVGNSTAAAVQSSATCPNNEHYEDAMQINEDAMQINDQHLPEQAMGMCTQHDVRNQSEETTTTNGQDNQYLEEDMQGLTSSVLEQPSEVTPSLDQENYTN